VRPGRLTLAPRHHPALDGFGTKDQEPRSHACNVRCNTPSDQEGQLVCDSTAEVLPCPIACLQYTHRSEKRYFDRLGDPDGAPVASCRYEDDLRVVQLPRVSITATLHPTRVNSEVCMSGNSARMELRGGAGNCAGGMEMWQSPTRECHAAPTSDCLKPDRLNRPSPLR
jgi:hypothetical protein